MKYIIITILIVLCSCGYDDEPSYVELPAFNYPIVKVFNGKIFVICGFHTEEGHFVDYGGIYSSDNGSDWVLVKDKPPFTPRVFSSAVVFNGRLWIIAGQDDSDATPNPTLLSDVWSSSNGKDWTMASRGQIEGLHRHTTFVHNGNMWIVGGMNHLYGMPSNLAYRSTDGKTWDRFVVSGASGGGQVVIKDGTIYRSSGSIIYTSTNAVIWDKSFEDTLVSSRGYHSFMYFQDKFWVIGGKNGSGRLYDTWTANIDNLGNWFRESTDSLKRDPTKATWFVDDETGWGIVEFNGRLLDINGGYWSGGTNDGGGAKYVSYNRVSSDGITWDNI